MFIVWGTKGYQESFGPTRVIDRCQHCGNDVTYHAGEVGTKFTLFWIPLFRTKRVFYLNCPICNQKRQVSRRELEDCLV